MTRPARSQEAPTRVRRTRINGRNVLTVTGKEDGYVYRIVNDTGDRIASLMQDGYELVDSKSVSVGDRRIDNPGAEGSKAQVSIGGGNKAYVMRIRQEWYDEDQKTKAEYVNELERSIKQSASTAADYGKLEIKTGS